MWDRRTSTAGPVHDPADLVYLSGESSSNACQSENSDELMRGSEPAVRDDFEDIPIGTECDNVWEHASAFRCLLDQLSVAEHPREVASALAESYCTLSEPLSEPVDPQSFPKTNHFVHPWDNPLNVSYKYLPAKDNLPMLGSRLRKQGEAQHRLGSAAIFEPNS